MTAVDVDALDKLREALARAHAADVRPQWVESGQRLDFSPVADALLPVVDRIANERAAAELEAAAGAIPCSDSEVEAKQILRDRAAALRASNGAGTT